MGHTSTPLPRTRHRISRSHARVGQYGTVEEIEVDTDPIGNTTWTQLPSISAGNYPFGVAATNDPNSVLITNFLDDPQGLDVIQG